MSAPSFKAHRSGCIASLRAHDERSCAGFATMPLFRGTQRLHPAYFVRRAATQIEQVEKRRTLRNDRLIAVTETSVNKPVIKHLNEVPKVILGELV